MASNYTETSIKTLSSLEHIRLRPGMYIGRLGNGAHAEDGIYVLLKATIDNSIDEFMMGQGRKIEVEFTELSGEPLYPIIHLEGEDIEIALTHGNHYGEEYWSFVNGQHTTMGGTHLAAFREALVGTVRNHFKKDYDAADIRQSIDAAIVVRV